MTYPKLNIESTQNFGATKSTFEKARILRKHMTKTEKLLWERIRKKQINGYHFRRQHPIDCYIVDFYCHELKLVIELDGEIHQFQKEYDKERQSELEAIGLKVLRFRNEDVEYSMESVIRTIKEHII
ncbi:endonuclease domain-containing protein [Saccharicrinis sp. FJH62]|uniref:endonuclease domain-containing protein n=1 Tax=Saccharicrinis sp. FJH62 TaxID=3344657 RepID=UPI0035D4D2B1